MKQCLAGIARSNLDNYLTLGPTRAGPRDPSWNPPGAHGAVLADRPVCLCQLNRSMQHKR